MMINLGVHVRRRALGGPKSIAEADAIAVTLYLHTLGPAIAGCVKDGSTPIHLTAERYAMHIFQLMKGKENVQAAQKYITGLAKQLEISGCKQ